MTSWIATIQQPVLEFWKAVGTVLVALIAAGIASIIQYRQAEIAHLQWKTAQNKLLLEMFERRLEVLNELCDACNRVFREDVNAKPGNYFATDVSSRAYWLFDSDILEFLENEVYKRIGKQIELKEKMLRSVDFEERKPYEDAWFTEKMWFRYRDSDLQKRMEPYLRIGIESVDTKFSLIPKRFRSKAA